MNRNRGGVVSSCLGSPPSLPNASLNPLGALPNLKPPGAGGGGGGGGGSVEPNMDV